jgi:hypothetical protein
MNVRPPARVVFERAGDGVNVSKAPGVSAYPDVHESEALVGQPEAGGLW